MKDKIQEAMAYAKELGVDYGDIRVKDIFLEHISAENGQINNLATSRSKGAGIRVYVDGAMGFAASSDLDKLKETVQLAYDTAVASAVLLRNKVVLSPKEAVTAKYKTPIKINSFDVPIEQKIDLLMACNKAMAGVDGVSRCGAYVDFRKEEVIFADTDNSYIEQEFYQSGGGIYAMAEDQQRSYGNLLRAGYEVVQELDLLGHSEKIAKEAVALSKAEDCPAGEFDLILMPTQLQLQIHESVGHPTELDRVLGSEAAFAGVSFVSPNDLNDTLKYGSEYVSIVADATSQKTNTGLGLGAFGYDDEGVPAQNITLIDKGIFKNFQSSRDNAPVINQNSHGMGISDGWENLPIVRMTNINLEPGTYEFDRLLAGIKHGFLLEENKSWSIDDKRVNFQFACQIAREIVDGKLTGKIFKNPIYTGKTTEFWASCDGVCNESYRQIVGMANCGKGQPMQLMRCAHASQPARFRKVRMIANG